MERILWAIFAMLSLIFVCALHAACNIADLGALIRKELRKP